MKITKNDLDANNYYKEDDVDTTEPVENRIAYIKANKPKEEVETRLKLLHKVKDTKTLKHALATSDHDAVEKLHCKECPNCPWDGKTIFPEGDNASAWI